MDKWVLIVFGGIGAANILIMSALSIGRWTQKVEAPGTLSKLSWDIEALTKEIKELRTIFENRYTGLEGRYDRDHQLLRGLINAKDVNDVKMCELRKDVDELMVRAGVTLNTNGHTA